MLTLDDKAVKELNNYIQELPLKYGLPLLNYINSKIQEQSIKENTKDKKAPEPDKEKNKHEAS